MTKRGWLGLVLLWALAACGDDSGDGGSTPCPEEVAAGDMLSCICPDDETLMGITFCDEETKLTPCDCSAAVPLGMGDPTMPMAPAEGGDPAGGDSPAAPGADATPMTPMAPMAASDAAVQPPLVDAGAGEETGGEATGGEEMGGEETGGEETGGEGAGGARPDDGDLLSVCESAVDCNRGLDCYVEGPGDGFCSPVCASDADCSGTEGGDYTCYTAGGVCRIVCEGEDDDGACPAGQACVSTGPGGFYRCAYPD